MQNKMKCIENILDFLLGEWKSLESLIHTFERLNIEQETARASAAAAASTNADNNNNPFSLKYSLRERSGKAAATSDPIKIEPSAKQQVCCCSMHTNHRCNFSYSEEMKGENLT